MSTLCDPIEAAHQAPPSLGGLACCNSWGRKESDTTKRLNWTELNWTLDFKSTRKSSKDDLILDALSRDKQMVEWRTDEFSRKNCMWKCTGPTGDPKWKTQNVRRKIQQYGLEDGSQGQVTVKETVAHTVTFYLYYNKSIKETKEVNDKNIIVSLEFH